MSERFVYVLKLRTDPEIRYVGQTRLLLADRFALHLVHAKHRRTPREVWLDDNRVDIEIAPIGIVKSVDALAIERFWTKTFLADGHRLLNSQQDIARALSGKEPRRWQCQPTASGAALAAVIDRGGALADDIRGKFHRTMLWRYTTGRATPTADAIGQLDIMSGGVIAAHGWTAAPLRRPQAAASHAAPST